MANRIPLSRRDSLKTIAAGGALLGGGALTASTAFGQDDGMNGINPDAIQLVGECVDADREFATFRIDNDNEEAVTLRPEGTPVTDVEGDEPDDGDEPDGGDELPDDGDELPDEGDELPDDGDELPDEGDELPDDGDDEDEDEDDEDITVPANASVELTTDLESDCTATVRLYLNEEPVADETVDYYETEAHC